MTQVEQILMYSQDYPFDSLEIGPLMNTWRQNKEHFIQRFGGTIWRSKDKITLNLTDTIKNFTLLFSLNH